MKSFRSSVRLLFSSLLVAVAWLTIGVPALAQTDPLPSWNDGPAKQAIVEFVQTTDPKHSLTKVSNRVSRFSY